MARNSTTTSFFAVPRPDQIPQNLRQSLRSLPDDSQLHPPPVASSSMMKINKLRENIPVMNLIVKKVTLNLIL